MQSIPNNNKPAPFIGMKVKIAGTDIIGDVVEISKEVKNLITKIKAINADGKVEYYEVKEVVLDAIEIVELLFKKGIFKKIGDFFKNLFSKKK